MSSSASPQRVLSIQSHVVHGYVGNKAAVFPLQLLGLDVDFINSVQFSSHTGYDHFPYGQVLNDEQLLNLLEGLEKNQLLENVGYLLTGYIGSTAFLQAVLDVLKTAKRVNPRLQFVCDPVLGDHGKFYVPPELAQVYRDVVIPQADVVTPNQFEVEQLTGIQIKSLDDAKQACAKLHSMGPSIVFLTSVVLEDAPGVISIVASSKTNTSDGTVTSEQWKIDCPKIPGSFTGTGDVTAALLLGHLAKSDNPDVALKTAMEKVINSMYVLIERTYKAQSDSVQSKELQLIKSKDIIENPPTQFTAVRMT
ncbi:pyridoxal/pyridoxamine kinase [Nitzschia inconspicua]|uniref:Pyridoxal/pyridoxamine kinase n=1 Tax=Nitzschia inconspicua TaxID=303405 RepID=A0A9K3KEB0_9STRA|nr:pyridoxal/pyridoxamine kinase [Nitzschia inconspicua]